MTYYPDEQNQKLSNSSDRRVYPRLLLTAALIVITVTAMTEVVPISSAYGEEKAPTPLPTVPRRTADRDRNAAMDFVKGRENPPEEAQPSVDLSEAQLEMQQNIEKRKRELERSLESAPSSVHETH